MANIDESFGSSVAKARSLLGMSQKELASALAERGMKVDASAVSRIEKGQRSVRLAEANVIAGALGRDLGDLLEASGTLQERLFAAYDQVEWRTTDLADAASKFVQSLFALSNLVQGNDDQLAMLRDEAVGQPTSGRDVPHWYATLLDAKQLDLKRERVRHDRFVAYTHADDIDGVRAAVSAAIEPSLVTFAELEALEEMGSGTRSILDTIWTGNVLGGGHDAPPSDAAE
ncbi:MULTISPECIES: helix-turn-helix transcriptional regulator [unclassified Microbacterium]|uniref:helix-turn-helix domain-containing protein n=1 Tax=unclassified Microbacterium TaxID=2609290 RepID=UPI00214ABED3|nr:MULTISPECIES: helix-turn-helix transcriptional regulator [unclassified Microbacterium]MCR2784077.1 helix-turn-helix domain-containing protein [Microbacterium sp. zg.B96]MDL5351005.1 helix-turn-helix transcriptional regulator [Microbacterium sp. zg-YB36]WIM15083.1 helix-turn-helix transcriptional regulator [Microbacterium sp. zg-B96]